jgi:hypothetical protein
MEPVVNFPYQLDEWAKKNGVGYTLTYFEAANEYELKIISSAKQEQFYAKRIYNFDNFKKWYEEETGLKGMFK